MDIKCMECGKNTFSFSLDNEDPNSYELKFTCPTCGKTTEIWVSSYGHEIKVEINN